MLFFFFLFWLFFSEIFIIDSFPELGFFVALIFPLILFFIYKNKIKQVRLPKISFLYIFFLIFSLFSAFQAIDKETSLKTTLIYFSGFLIFLFVFNMRETIKKGLSKFIIFSSVIFILIYSLNTIFNLHLFDNGHSLFFHYDHSQLGNYLVLPFIILFPQPAAWPFFLFSLFSFSRTAYLASIIGIINKKNSFLKVSVVVISLIFLLIVSKNYFFTKNKKIFGFRNFYFSYAISSIKEKPWFGVGPGNFFYAASKRQLNYNENTTTAHNIVLDILAENGSLAGVFFILFILTAIRRLKKDVYFWLFLSLSIIFLFDFSYRYSSFLFLWFLLLGIITQEKETLYFNSIIIPLILLIIYQPIILGEVFLKFGNYENSIKVFPFNKQIHFGLIEKQIMTYQPDRAIKELAELDKISDRDFFITEREANYYYALGRVNKALFYYEKTLSLYPFKIVLNTKISERILKTNRDLYGDKSGSDITARFLNNLVNKLDIKRGSDAFKTINNFCLNNKLKCYNVSY